MMQKEHCGENIIEYLLYAERDVHEVGKITSEHPTLSIDEAYALQDGLLERRQAENKTKTIGIKLCMTSLERQKSFGINKPIYGFLQTDMLAYEWKPIVRNELIHPLVEAELAFFIGETIKDAHVTAETLLRATSYVTPALEIIDSRYKDYRFTVADVIADNCSSAKFVMGSSFHKPADINFSNIGMVMTKNGDIVQTGTSAAVLGNPLKAVTETVKELVKRGKQLAEGDIVLSGPFTTGIPLEKGDTFVASFEQLGTVSISAI